MSHKVRIDSGVIAHTKNASVMECALQGLGWSAAGDLSDDQERKLIALDEVWKANDSKYRRERKAIKQTEKSTDAAYVTRFESIVGDLL